MHIVPEPGPQRNSAKVSGFRTFKSKLSRIYQDFQKIHIASDYMRLIDFATISINNWLKKNSFGAFKGLVKKYLRIFG
jgi:hypothetical protein